jgi:hypothetical protein
MDLTKVVTGTLLEVSKYMLLIEGCWCSAILIGWTNLPIHPTPTLCRRL